MRNEHEKIAQLLHDVAAEMPADPKLERRTLRRSRRRRALNAGVGVALVTVLVAGSFAGVRLLSPNGPTMPTNPSETTPPPLSQADVVVVVQDLVFDTERIEIPSGTPITLRLENRDAGVPHNFSIYPERRNGEPALAAPIFRGEIVTGPSRIDYEIPPLEAGTYSFQCDVHPGSEPGVLVAVPSQTLPTDPQAALPDEVVTTRATILDAIAAGDLDALEELIDPMTFAYNFSDGSNPIPEWRDDPSALEPIPQVLDMPSYVTPELEGPDGFVGEFYQWPYLMEPGSLDEVSDEERADLYALGFDDGDIRRMQDIGAYLGPRLVIRADGLWTAYATGGD